MVSEFERYKNTIIPEGSGERAENEKKKMIKKTTDKIQSLGKKNNEYGDNDKKTREQHELLERLKKL